MSSKEVLTSHELFGTECGEGWEKLYKPLYEACAELNIDVMQVKEKFGQLRFYMGPAPAWLWAMADNMERLSAYVCETCGKSGTLRTDRGWIKTLCDEHAKEES